MHPAHHYRIHLWDDEKAENALALRGPVRADVAGHRPHVAHAGAHLFARRKRYDDACWQQEASARVDHAHMMRDRVLPDQIHNFAHNNEWLIRDMIFVGRMRDAIDLAKNMSSCRGIPSTTRSTKGSANFGRMRLFEVLTRFELWDELIALCDTPYLEPTDNDDEQVKRLRHLGDGLLSHAATRPGRHAAGRRAAATGRSEGGAGEGRRPKPRRRPARRRRTTRS